MYKAVELYTFSDLSREGQLLTKPELALTTLSQLPALSMPIVVSNPMPPGQVSLLGILVTYLFKVSGTDCCVSLCEQRVKLQFKLFKYKLSRAKILF